MAVAPAVGQAHVLAGGAFPDEAEGFEDPDGPGVEGIARRLHPVDAELTEGMVEGKAGDPGAHALTAPEGTGQGVSKSIGVRPPSPPTAWTS